MIVYQVELKVNEDVVDAYREWLRHHVDEMVELPQITGATWLNDTEDPHCFVVQYELSNQGAMEEYLAQHAPRMRAQAMKDFEGQFTAKRRIFERG